MSKKRLIMQEFYLRLKGLNQVIPVVQTLTPGLVHLYILGNGTIIHTVGG